LLFDQLSIHRRNPSQFSSSFVRLFLVVRRWPQGRRSSLAWQSPQMRGNAGLLSQQAREKPNIGAFSSSKPVGIACVAKSFSKRVAAPATIPFDPHKPIRNFCAGSCLVSLQSKIQTARGRSANSCATTAPVRLAGIRSPLKRERCRRRGGRVRRGRVAKKLPRAALASLKWAVTLW
jgi:hypothetical protein